MFLEKCISYSTIYTSSIRISVFDFGIKYQSARFYRIFISNVLKWLQRSEQNQRTKIKSKQENENDGCFSQFLFLYGLYLHMVWNMFTLHYRYIINVKEKKTRSDSPHLRGRQHFSTFLQFCQTNDFTFIAFLLKNIHAEDFFFIFRSILPSN